MANPVPELQQPTNKSIIELFSLELIPDLHFAKTAMTPTYSVWYNNNSISKWSWNASWNNNTFKFYFG